MSKNNAIIKKLFRLALYTSLLLSAVSVIPWMLTLAVTSYFFFLILFLFVFTNTLMIWLINIWLVQWLDDKKHSKRIVTVRYALSFILSIGLSGLLIHFFQSFELYDIYISDDEFVRFQKRNVMAPFFTAFFTNIFVLFMQELMLLREKKAHIELENARLKLENTEAINQQLKQHIHPHFLFNSLSILKSLIHNNPALAEEYVIRLSDFLRVSLSSGESNLVSLKNELRLCEDYIEMQKIRFGDALEFDMDIPGEVVATGFVPGFSLQLLLENAIKHNAFRTDSPLRITISEHKGWLRVSNNYKEKSTIESNTGSGLANLAQRYTIVSGHDIHIDTTGGTFTVSIKILTHENHHY